MCKAHTPSRGVCPPRLKFTPFKTLFIEFSVKFYFRIFYLQDFIQFINITVPSCTRSCMYKYAHTSSSTSFTLSTCHVLRLPKHVHCLLTMVDRRRKALFFLFLIALSPTPFFSERQTSTQTPLREPPDRINSPHERAQLLTRLLLTPTFLFHLLWITGLLLLSVAALLDVLLKFVYVTCSEGLKYVTPESLQAKSVISRYNTLP